MERAIQFAKSMMKDQRLKILFILPSLKAGGAERVISFVASNINKEKFHAVLLVLGNPEDAVFPIDNLEVHFLSKQRLLHSLTEIFGFILSHKPRIVVGSIAHVNRVLSVFRFIFRKVIFVGREASVDLIIEQFTNKNRTKYWKLYKNYYKNLDVVLCQSQDMATDLIERYNLSEKKIHLINNPIACDLPVKKPDLEKSEVKQLITIGRLNREKGHERILQTISKLKFPFQYTLVGDGPEKDNIFELADQLGIKDKIIHVPFTDNVETYLSQCDLFIQGSFVEGFPNTLLESCVVGTPVVAMAAMGGTREIVEQGINGFIARDENEFLDFIEKSLHMDWDPFTIRNSVTNKFSEDIIIPKYEDFFESLITKP